MRKWLLRQSTDDETNAQIAPVESQLELQYEHSSSALALRSGQWWREQGESKERDRIPISIDAYVNDSSNNISAQ
ncbi:hypothetical protein G6F66_014723 [Rhizopus arrhizus]|nr:hypothetical protein G6F66_014723 [Rhizopus arrhizus]